MDFIIVVLSLCAVASSHLQHALLSLSSLRSSIASHHQPYNKFRPIGPIRGSKNDLNPQNLYSSISMSNPLGPMYLGTYASLLEDQPDAEDYGQSPTFRTVIADILDKTLNSHGVYSSPMQYHQLPSRFRYTSSKHGHQPSYYPNTGFPIPSSIPGGLSSLYENYPSVAREGEDAPVPKWTSFDNRFQKMALILRTNMVNPDSINNSSLNDDYWLNERAIHTLIVGVVLQLMDEVAKGKEQYEEIFESYIPYVLSTIDKPSVTPQELAKVISDRMIDIDEANAMLRSYIGFMSHSIYCNDLSQCDKVIDDTLKTTTNKRLKEEAELLLAEDEFCELFLSKYATDFEETANTLSVSKYFADVDNHNVEELKPLVLAGAELIKRRKEIGPVQPLDQSVFP